MVAGFSVMFLVATSVFCPEIINLGAKSKYIFKNFLLLGVWSEIAVAICIMVILHHPYPTQSNGVIKSP